jgi:hypothetical protein
LFSHPIIRGQNTIVKEIIDLDAIKKTYDYIKGVFDRSEIIDNFKQEIRDELKNNIGKYRSIDDFIEVNSNYYSEILEGVYGYERSNTKTYFEDWIGKNIDFGNVFNKKDTLIKLNSTNFQTLDSLVTQDYILKNKEECLKLQSNIEHVLEFNQFGKCMNPENFPNLDSITIPIQNIDGYEIPLPTRMLVRITENDSLLLMTIVRTGTKKPIHWNQKTDQYYYKSKSPKVKTIYDESLEKNKVLVSQSMYNEKLINGILLQRRDFVNQKLYEILKKDK